MLLLRVLPAVLVATTLPAGAQASHALLDTDPLPPGAHLVLRLHAGGYTVRSSPDGRVHLSESRDGTPDDPRKTEVRFHQTKDGARLEVEPPTGNHNGRQITIALPHCAALDLTLTAGELVFEDVPCDATDASIRAGELRATLPDPAEFREIEASVTIGEVDAPGLGNSKEDEEHGGFFRSFRRTGTGHRTFRSHVGTGQITLGRPQG